MTKPLQSHKDSLCLSASVKKPISSNYIQTLLQLQQKLNTHSYFLLKSVTSN